MKIKNKILTILFITFFAFLVKVPSINAACSVSVSTVKSAVVGSTFKVTTNVSSDVGSWYYVLGYDPSKVQLISGSPKVVGVIGDSRTNSYTFKALKSGTVTFSASNVSLASNSTNSSCSASAGSASVVMKTQAEIEASYSRNNNLSSLVVEGAELSPSFNSNVTEYFTTLPVDTTKAVIKASLADSTATVTGTGEIDVVDGLNKVEIVVTAQHGEKKTYVINITVQELDPITVSVNNKKYTVVRKKGQVEKIPTGFEETSITIGDQQVAAYKSNITKLTLVGLKDEEGKIELFIYNASNKKYESFKEVSGSNVNLILLDNYSSSIPKGFKNVSFDYKDGKVNGYKFILDSENNYYLVYAQNLENGSTGFYLYDAKEGTFQRYYNEMDGLKNKIIIIMAGIIVSLVLLLALIIFVKIIKSFSKKNKKKQKIYDEEDYYEIDKLNVSDEPIIRKVEEDEYIVPKKSRKQKRKEIEEAKKKLDKSKNSFRRVSLEEDD